MTSAFMEKSLALLGAHSQNAAKAWQLARSSNARPDPFLPDSRRVYTLGVTLLLSGHAPYSRNGARIHPLIYAPWI